MAGEMALFNDMGGRLGSLAPTMDEDMRRGISKLAWEIHTPRRRVLRGCIGYDDLNEVKKSSASYPLC
jgi:hypothetical protein